jgi:3-oxoadipate enol-lactonase
MPYVSNHGIHIYYEAYGSGVPIVFLHPFSTNGYIWYFQIFPLAQTNQCVVLDLRGHGRSDKPQQGYSIKAMATDVTAVLDALAIEAAVFVGNSIGGMIAMQCSLDYPERVRGNVIVSSVTGLTRHMPAEALVAFQQDYHGAFLRLFEGAVSAKTKQERGEILDLLQAQFMVEANFPAHVFTASSQDPEGVFNWDISDRLKDISQPTLVLAGEADQALPIEVNSILAENIPDAELRVVKDVGHFYQLEKPREFTNVVRQFLARIRG